MIHILTFCALVTIAVGAPDYYWRPYIPANIYDDAVIGTWDGRVKTFIGNVPIGGSGVYVGQIFPGQDYLLVAGVTGSNEGPIFEGVNHIQILCSGNPDSFEWVTANSTSLTKIPNLVKGGYEGVPFKPLYIGRVVHAGLKIGKVVASDPNKSDLYLADNDMLIQYGKYEVLTYAGKKTNV